MQYPRAEAHDLYPIMRRAMIESQLAEAAKEYPEISAEPTPNPTGTSYYRLLSSGNVRLTVNAVDHPNTKVRRAMFRNTYAQASQPNLFGETPEEGTMLYGILLHGPELINKTRPEFAHIVIPNRDCSKYLGRIDLFGRYSGLVSELWTYEEEEIPDELDAFSEWHEWQAETCTPYVFLDADKESGPRSRFDAAHELGHLVMHRAIDPRYIRNRTTFRVMEDQAHRFAGAFLLPALAFSNDFSVANLDAFLALKAKWKVSEGMMVHRSEDLSLVSKEQARRLWINRTRRGWRRKEPLDDQLPIERPRLLKRAFSMIVEEGIQSVDDIRAALPYSVGDIVELANLPPRFLEEDVAPISLKAYSKKRYGGMRRSTEGSGEVVEFRTAGDGSEG